MPKNDGYSLLATKDTVGQGFERLGAIVLNPESVQPSVFDDSFAVAEISLIQKDTIENSLPQLVKVFYEEGYALPHLKEENMLSRATRAMGKSTTFRAQWTDYTQRDFVVEVKPPTQETDEIYYHHWRKLNPLSDFQGTVIPIGRKPNSSKDQILQTLNRQPERVVQGQIQLQPRSFVTKSKSK